MSFLRTLSLWIHAASVVTWFGGLFFYLAVADPVARGAGSAAERLRAVCDIDQRFRRVIWGSVELAVVTGIALLVITLFQAGSAVSLSGAYARVFLAKLLLVVVIIGMQLYNHVRINPLKRRLSDEEPFLRLQSRTRQIYGLELVVAAAIVLLGVHLRSVF
jgi:uncharacterized membrane protein